MNTCLSILLVAFNVCLINGQTALPRISALCYQKDPQVAECIKREIERLVPLYKSGYKEIELESLDPLLFKNLKYNFNSRLIGGSVFIPTVSINGFENLKVMNVRPDFSNPRKFQIEFDVFVPKMDVKLLYDLAGNVLAFPVKLNGKLDFEVENVYMTYNLRGDLQKFGDHEYLSLKSLMWKLKGEGVESLRLHNNDIVNGQPILNGIVVGIINSSWRQLKTSFVPFIAADKDKIFLKKFVKVFIKLPFDIVFPK